MANLLFKFQNVSNILFFVIRNVKRKWKIRYSIHFLAQQKERLNKQNLLAITLHIFVSLKAFLSPRRPHKEYTLEKKHHKKHLLSQVQLKNAFVTDAAFKIELNQEKSMYLSLSKRVARIHLQSWHVSPSFRLAFFISYLNIHFHCRWC